MGLTEMKADTATILTDWNETLTVLRDTVTYSSGKPSHSWSSKGTITGDWQPVSGKTVMLEASRETKSEAVVYCAVDVNVLENDKIQRADSTFMFVNYIGKHEDHWAIFLKKNA